MRIVYIFISIVRVYNVLRYRRRHETAEEKVENDPGRAGANTVADTRHIVDILQIRTLPHRQDPRGVQR